MLDITTFSNALLRSRVSVLKSLGVGPFIGADGGVVSFTGDDAIVFPLGGASGTPKYALRLPLEHSAAWSWPHRYADIAGLAGAIADVLPANLTILDVEDIPGTGVALLYDWVPGETLTARVTGARHRHDRDRLSDLLWPLADIADALRVSGTVHGDISPGNIVVRPDGGMTLIDLDRMGFRDDGSSLEPRRRAGYRIPRGGGAPAEEDAFSLLVLMASCAILADSNVPIDHERAAESSHPALLFSSWDLMDLQRSRLVRDVEHQLTTVSRELLTLLTAASSGPSSRIPSMLRDAVRKVRHYHSAPEPAGEASPEIAPTWRPAMASPAVAEPDALTDRVVWGTATEVLPAASIESSWPRPDRSLQPERERVGQDDWNLPQTEELLQRLRSLPSVESHPAGAHRRAARADRRKAAVTEELHRALRENDRDVLVRLAMSGSLAELGDSDRSELLKVVRALAHDSITRAVASDDDGMIAAAVDESVFQRDTDIDHAFRDRVRVARERVVWTDRLHDAVRERDARTCQTLLSDAPDDAISRTPEPIRRQAARLVDQREAELAAAEALTHRDADGLAQALGRLSRVRPTWTDVIDASAVVDLLGEEQIEERLVRELRNGALDDEHHWMVDIVIAAGRLPEVTRLAGLTPRDVDTIIYKPV